MPQPFKVEHLCELPAHFAKSEIVVRPCVALLHSYDETSGKNGDPEVSLIPRLDPKEVAAVFTVSFRDLLSRRLKGDHEDEWYQGAWMDWFGYPWRSEYQSRVHPVVHYIRCTNRWHFFYLFHFILLFPAYYRYADS